MTFSDVTHLDDRAHGLEGLERLLRGEIREYAAEKRYVRKDGRTVWASSQSPWCATPGVGRCTP